MKLYFLFRDYNLEFVYDLQIRPKPIYAVSFKGYSLKQLYFVPHSIDRFSKVFTKYWKDYKVKRL